MTAPLSRRERAICDYAAKLTDTPWAMTKTDIDLLREESLGDRDILDVAMITAYYAYVNRIADGLGVGIEGDGDKLGW